MIFVETKSFEFSEQDKLRKFSYCPSNILQVTGLEEGERETAEGPREELVIKESRERELSQSEEFEEEEIVRYRSIQAIYDQTNLFCSEFSLLLAEEPSSFSLAAKQEVWRNAMKEEISAILRNNTWTIIKPNKDIKPIGVKLVFRVKKDSMGKVVRYKARLIVKGYAQKQGIEWNPLES